MSELSLPSFPSVHIVTDDLLGGSTQQAVASAQEPIVPITDPQPPVQGDPVTGAVDPVNQPNPDDPVTTPSNSNPDQNVEDELKDYSPTALYVKLLESEGLGIYEELPKDLTPQQFVKDLPEFISTTVDDRVNERLEKLGSYAEYFKLLDQGVKPEELAPAYQLQKVADFDINGSDVTDDHLTNVVIQMHVLRGLTEEEGKQLADVAKSQNLLKQKAQESINYHKDYIKHLQDRALAEHQSAIEAEKLAAQQEQTNILNVLKTGKINNIPITKEDQNKIFDTLYKKNIVVNWVDDKGEKQQSLASKWEVEMHQIIHDPQKLIMLAWLVSNDFNVNNTLAGPITENLNKQIIDALNRTSEPKTKTTVVNQQNNNSGAVSRFAPQAISIEK